MRKMKKPENWAQHAWLWQAISMGEDRANPPINPDLLERMARIARVLPGHVVSADVPLPPQDIDPPPESGVVLRIDGVVAKAVFDELAG